VEWVFPPRYKGGRFTAERYAALEMKPKIFAVCQVISPYA